MQEMGREYFQQVIKNFGKKDAIKFDNSPLSLQQ